MRLHGNKYWWEASLRPGNYRATATTENSYIEFENGQVLTGITVGSNLNFQNHIKNDFKKASQMWNVLARIAPYRHIQK